MQRRTRVSSSPDHNIQKILFSLSFTPLSEMGIALQFLELEKKNSSMYLFKWKQYQAKSATGFLELSSNGFSSKLRPRNLLPSFGLLQFLRFRNPHHVLHDVRHIVHFRCLKLSAARHEVLRSGKTKNLPPPSRCPSAYGTLFHIELQLPPEGATEAARKKLRTEPPAASDPSHD